MTYYNLDKNGNKVGSETVTIKVKPITDGIFLVTWQESDKTTVVHIEDYNRQTIVTNITEADLIFDQFHGRSESCHEHGFARSGLSADTADRHLCL